MTSKEIVNEWCEFLLSDWCSDVFWENTLNQKNQLINDLTKLEKLEKAIETIKMHKSHKLRMLQTSNNVDEYNNIAKLYGYHLLIEKEYKLLKEVFEDENC